MSNNCFNFTQISFLCLARLLNCPKKVSQSLCSSVSLIVGEISLWYTMLNRGPLVAMFCGNVVSSQLHELIQSSSPGFLLSVTTKIPQTSHQLLEEKEFILHRRQLRKAKICTILLMLSVVKIQSIHVKPGWTHRNTQLFF
jgi:hypothetical protein